MYNVCFVLFQQQYDRVLQYMERTSKYMTTVAYRTHIHQTELSTIWYVMTQGVLPIDLLHCSGQ